MNAKEELLDSFVVCVESVTGFDEKYPSQAAFLIEALSFAYEFPLILLGEDILDADDEEILNILNQGIFDLKDSIKNLYLGNLKLAMISLRCFLENIFFAIYYREQAIDFALWRRSPNDFVMLHQLYDEKHPFRKYFKTIFEDRKDPQWGGQGKFSKKIFQTLQTTYSSLSWSVHGRPDQREANAGQLNMDEVDLYCKRLETTLTICYEFINTVGTSPRDNVPKRFMYTKEKNYDE